MNSVLPAIVLMLALLNAACSSGGAGTQAPPSGTNPQTNDYVAPDTKVILWSCNGAANEKWSELANGELKLQSHGGTLCLDDPRSSTTNGTQLIVYSCTDSANQKWKLP